MFVAPMQKKLKLRRSGMLLIRLGLMSPLAGA